MGDISSMTSRLSSVHSPKQRQALNTVAGRLTGIELRGIAVVVPCDRATSSKGCMPPRAHFRSNGQALQRNVTLAAVLAAFDASKKNEVPGLGCNWLKMSHSNPPSPSSGNCRRHATVEDDEKLAVTS